MAVIHLGSPNWYVDVASGFWGLAISESLGSQHESLPLCRVRTVMQRDASHDFW
jgi:hypothetical protein